MPPTPNDGLGEEERNQLRASMSSPVNNFEAFDDGDLLGDGDEDRLRDEEEDDDGEDLVGDDMENDYRPIPELDRYDPDMVDDSVYSDISMSERVAAEREMQHRDKAKGLHRDARDLFYEDGDEDDEIPRAKRMAGEGKTLEVDTEDQEMVESIENLEDTKGHSTKDWVSMLGPRTEIANRFKNFLRSFVDEKKHQKYRERIRRMCEQNKSSFEVSYTDLANKEHVLAYFLPEAPFQMFEIFDKVAKDIVLSIFPTYERVTTEIHVRIADLPLIEELRTFRKLHLNQLVRTLGVVTATTGVLPQLSVIKYDCVKCGYVLGPFVQSQNAEIKPGSCPECQSVGPFSINMEQTLYRNYQKVTLRSPREESQPVAFLVARTASCWPICATSANQVTRSR